MRDTHPIKAPKKLIEVALPLDAINKAARDEKAVPRPGHPQTMHYWWARRPLAAARAVIFGQMVNDPSWKWEMDHPGEVPPNNLKASWAASRKRIFTILEELVKWENTANEDVLEKARAEINKSWRETCDLNRDHPQAAGLFNPDKLPGLHDPFAGGGAIPLEAQRLGLEAFASDLNPVAVVINKAMIEIPPKFAGLPPVNPGWNNRSEAEKALRQWHGPEGLADDVRFYGQWVRDEVAKRIGNLYPHVEITADIAKGRPELKALVGQKLVVIAWLWARTVRSPNPAFRHVEVPLTSTFMLSDKKGKEVYVRPVVTDDGYRFSVATGTPPTGTENGTKLARANFRCLLSGAPISGDYIKVEGKAGRLGARLMAMVADGPRGRVYIAPTPEHEAAAQSATPGWRPSGEVPSRLTGGTCVPYGLNEWGDLFTRRQLLAVTQFSDLITEVQAKARAEALLASFSDDKNGLDAGGSGATAYAEAISVYLANALSRLASYNNSICHWNMKGGSVAQIFARQAIPMSWDYIEVNPLEKMSGNWAGGIEWVSDVFENLPATPPGFSFQANATEQDLSSNKIVSTDPPYYDNISYADLSDFFYVWLRKVLRQVFPSLFATLSVPKAEELVHRTINALYYSFAADAVCASADARSGTAWSLR